MDFQGYITTKAAQCGWKISNVLSENLVCINFDTDYGTESIFVRPCGKNGDGNTILEFTSKGLPLPPDAGQQASIALSLMERNGEMLLGHWGIEKIGEDKYFTIFVSQIAQTMDNDEFRASVRAILSERGRLMKDMQKVTIEF